MTINIRNMCLEYEWHESSHSQVATPTLWYIPSRVTCGKLRLIAQMAAPGILCVGAPPGKTSTGNVSAA